MSSQQNDHEHTNHLIHENSPYLLQHAHNPVDWYPWGEEALTKAKEEDKMLLVSIGYAACHWCHVMEHESFEDSTVAALMNENFVCIKVDREERPDIDDVYMTACQLASGRGCGWPLNSFALPDGRPVWAGTYFPKEQWMKVLDQFKTMWISDRQKLDDYATQLTAGIQQQDQIVLGQPQPIKREDAEVMAAAMMKQVDKKKGGRKGAPKFPMPNNYMYLLNYHVMTGDNEALDMVMTTLDAMANGGIYDQLGGGFARYSTDENWLVPHFEKMLYDNAQLVSLYAAAFRVTKNSKYKKIINETINWIDRELTDTKGGFYSSLDADSEGEEGKFYVWSAEEIDALLPEETSSVYKAFYSITEHGNWEETNILHRTKSKKEIAADFNISENQIDQMITESNQLLLKARNKRVHPGLDDKILTSWNGLMTSGLLDAFQALRSDDLLKRALKNATFIKDHMLHEDYRLVRNYKDGQVKINGFLDDYAFTIEAFIKLYQNTFDETWLYDAKKLAEYSIQYFYDEDSRFFNYTSDLDPPLIARKRELGDNVIPGSNSAMARNLHILGQYFPNSKYQEMSDTMLFSMLDPILQSGQTSFYSNWSILFLEKMQPTYEIAIVGDDYLTLAAEMQKTFLPNTIYLGGKDEGTLELLKDKLQGDQTMIYVCQNKVCQLPVSEPGKAIDQLRYF